MEVRYGRLHNISMAVVATGMIGTALLLMAQHPDRAPRLSFNDPRFDLYLLLGLALVFYAWLGHHPIYQPRAAGGDRPRRHRRWASAATGDSPGMRSNGCACTGWRSGRSCRSASTPQAFVEANLRLSMWNLDDGLRPIRGVPAAVAGARQWTRCPRSGHA